MATRKKTTNHAPSWAPHHARTFAHPDGRTYELQVIDCRIYESWVNAGPGGGSNVSTQGSDDEASAFASKKASDLTKKGFVEGPTKTGRMPDRSANVVDVMRSNLNYQGRPRDDFQPLPHRPHTFFFGNASLDEWLITSDDGTAAILMRCSVHKSTLSTQARGAIADAVLDVLTQQRDAILADETTPVRKLALGPTAAPFTHLVVLSPTVENHLVEWSFAVSRSVFRAFPAFDCEIRESDSVPVAEARCKGHASLPSGKWDRAPHPVFDLAHPKKPGDVPAFLVYPPAQLEARLIKGLAKLKEAEVHARNYLGEVRRFVRGQSPPELSELRAFFGFDISRGV